jgi:hypothetical protein
MDVHHRFKLVYDGLGASENRMPQALKHEIGEGMQWFVGAPLWYAVEGSVPSRIPTHATFYEFDDFQERQACWIVEMDVTTSAVILGGGYLLRDVTKDLIGDALKAGVKRAFRHFVKSSYDAMMKRELVEHAPRERIEPFLTMPGDNMAAEAAEQLLQKQRLYRRMNGAMANITSPIHRAATQVDVWFDEEHLGCIDWRIYGDVQIESAIRSLMKDDGMWPPKPPQ